MNDISLLIKDICSACPDLSILENEPMARHCSFHIGGSCAALLQPASVDEVQRICSLLRRSGVVPLVIGNGTNLLISDEALPYIVLQMGEGMAWVEQSSDTVLRAGCGITLCRLAATAAAAGLTGLEFAHGIPGTLGGGISMNAGAYGGEMKDVLRSAQWLDEELQLREGSELDLSYRHSRFSGTGDIILSAELALQPGSTEVIRETMQQLMERRRNSQPLDKPSAGSTFKRPVGGYAAALIDEAGLKGFAIGGAMVSEKHAGFVVNRGGATFEDVLRVMEHVQERVLATSGITLEPEVKIIRP